MDPPENNTSRSDLNPVETISRQEGRYLLAIFWLSITKSDRIQTGQLSEYLDVKPATVTEMMTKLAEQSTVDYEKQFGVTLTNHGEAIASNLAWRHCVVMNYFNTVLDTQLPDTMAYQIGYILSAEGIDQLHATLDHPCQEFCQHSEQKYEGCLIAEQAP
ncbi:MAG: metal-dependent transcriptional regulator [Halobacteriaceae archaeon]